MYYAVFSILSSPTPSHYVVILHFCVIRFFDHFKKYMQDMGVYQKLSSKKREKSTHKILINNII